VLLGPKTIESKYDILHINERSHSCPSCIGVDADGYFDGDQRDEHYCPEKCHKRTRGVEIELWDLLSTADDEGD
jgi:ribosomal protein L37AE/L43A